GFEHQLSGEQVVGDASERIDVRTPIDVGVAEDGFRRHIRRGAARGVVEGRQVVGTTAVVNLHQAEVEHLDEVVFEPHPADVDIGRFDVTVDKAARMRVGQRVGDLAQQIDGAARRYGAELAHQ